MVADRVAGWLGEIHPLVAQQWDLEDTVAAFELDFDPIAAHAVDAPTYEDLTSFPEVREDLAVVVAEQTSAAEVLEAVRSAGAPLLTQAEVFDVYRDPQRIGADKVSLAIRLAYRASDRTLTDEEVKAKRDAIVKALETELHGRIRAS